MMITELETHATTIDTRQSCWTHRRTFEQRGHKIRTTVDMDSYEFQSHFYVEVFSPATLTWNRVHTETNTWWVGVRALSSDQLTPNQLELLNTLELHMVRVAADLLA